MQGMVCTTDCPYIGEPLCTHTLGSDAIALLKTITPRKPYESRAKAPCSCGKKHPTTWFSLKRDADWKVMIKCDACGQFATGMTEIDAIRTWNAMVKGE